MNIKECLGKNVLYEVHLPKLEGLIQDGTVEEFSPSGKYVRIDFIWNAVERVNVLEEVPLRGARVGSGTVQTSEPVPANDATGEPAQPTPETPAGGEAAVALRQ